jgi:transcriptional regulator with XRE-family HTH domain
MTDEPRRRPGRLSSSVLATMGQHAGFQTADERAAVLGISRSHLLHVERGAVRPSAKVVDAMSEAYHQPVEKIERAAVLARTTLAHRIIAQANSVES